MLALKPTCENCNQALPADSRDAMICSFECTFCRTCVTDVLDDVCPNCGGGFCARPIRPATSWKGEWYLGEHPASTTVKHRPVDAVAHRQFVAQVAKPAHLR
jgi:hypothetical protein